MKNKRFLALFFSVLVVAGLLVACGGNGSTNEGAPNGADAAADGSAGGAEGATQLVFWHGLSGKAGENLENVISMFNASQSDVFVESQYQGSYEDALNKLKTSMRTNDGPDVVQIYEAGTRFMIDSGFIIPMQEIIDEYDLDISKLEQHILDYYTVDGRLNSMPLNTSMPLFFYNKDILSQVGYENGPETWDEISDISQKVMDQNLASFGFANANLLWWFEQPMVQQRYPMVDNDNGRSAAATRSTLADGDVAVTLLEKWLEMYNNGYMGDLGFDVGDNRAAFWSGGAAMMVDSSGNLSTTLDTIDGAFELGVCFLPAVTADAPNGGVTLGGTSIYICDNGRGSEMNPLIAEFIRYIIAPETQAYFHINSGYVPITTEAYELDDVKENLEKYPQYQVITDQLHFSENMGFGAMYGTLVEGRAVYQNYIEQMLLGQVTPEECVNKSVEEIDKLIADYNLANQ